MSDIQTATPVETTLPSAEENYDDRLVVPAEEKTPDKVAAKEKPQAKDAPEKQAKSEENETDKSPDKKSAKDEDRDFFMEALEQKEEARKYREEAMRVAQVLQGIASKKDLKELVKLGVIDEESLIEASANIIRARVEQENMTEEQKAELAYKRTLEEKAKKAEELEKRISEFERKEAQIKYEAQLERDVPVALESAGLPNASEYHLAVYDLIERSIDLMDEPLTPSQAARIVKMKVTESNSRRWASLETLPDEDLINEIPEAVRERLRKAEVARARKGESKQADKAPAFDPEDEKGLTWDEKIERRLRKLTSGE